MNICYIISGVTKSYPLEWVFETLIAKEINLHLFLINDTDAENSLVEFAKKSNINYKQIICKNKVELLKSIFTLSSFLKKNNITIVHCHLFEASLLGITTAWLLRIKKRIYTKHNALIHIKYAPKGLKYDKFINLLATDIVSISNVTTDILLNYEKVNPKKITKIHHGFDFKTIEQLSKNDLRLKYNIPNDKKVIGIISRYIKYKNVPIIIQALSKAITTHNLFIVLANVGGPENEHVQQELKKILKNSYVEIEFENNIFALYKCFDVFIHAPESLLDEAFGQVYVEAMYMKVPIITTVSGIVNEIENKENLFSLVDYNSSECIYNALVKVIEQKNESILEQAHQYSIKHFGIEKMCNELIELYKK